LNSANIFRRTLAFLLLAAALAGAETIHLKNGRTILADSVRENNNKVEYTIGDNTFAISKSSVDRIDAGGSPIVTRSSGDMPGPAATPEFHFSADFAISIIHDGQVDPDAVAEAERAGGEKAAVADYLAAHFEHDHARLDSAIKYMERARNFMPEEAVLAGHEANFLLEANQPGRAAELAERTIRLAPNESFGYSILGYAFYQQGKLPEAIKALKKAQLISPDPNVATLLARAERELKAEGDFTEQASSHFTLRYEGGQATPQMRRDILATLEAHYDDLVRELDYSPRESIIVLLYTNQQYFNVTQAPSWAGALYDGRLRMPISGLTSVNSDLSRSLRHELTHSFISQIAKNRCPTWLNEGIAQLVEPRSASSDGRVLSYLFANGRQMPFNQLEGQWTRFSTSQARIAYTEALSVTEYIRDTYGMSALSDVLKRMGEGQGIESAMRGAIHSGYAQLEQEYSAHLKRTYGQ
jgi:hypothetical protein